QRIRASLYNELASRVFLSRRAPVQIQLRDAVTNVVPRRIGELSFKVTHLAPLDLARASVPHVDTTIDSGVARMILSDLGAQPPKDWRAIITEPRIKELLKRFQ